MLTLCELENPPAFKIVVKVFNNPRALETISELECGHFVSIKVKQTDLPFIGRVPNIEVVYGTLEKKDDVKVQKAPPEDGVAGQTKA